MIFDFDVDVKSIKMTNCQTEVEQDAILVRGSGELDNKICDCGWNLTMLFTSEAMNVTGGRLDTVSRQQIMDSVDVVVTQYARVLKSALCETIDELQESEVDE